MRSPFVAMLWDQWLRTRWTILIVVGLCLASSAFFYVIGRIWPTPDNIALFAGWNLWGCAYWLAYLGFLVQLNSERRVDGSPGRYLLTMPIPTWQITCASMVYVVVVVAPMASGVAVLGKWLLGGNIMVNHGKVSPFSYWQYPAFCIYLSLLGQSIVCFAGSMSELAILPVMCGLAASIIGGIWLIATQQPVVYNVALWLFGCVMAYFVSYAGIRHYRCQPRESIIPRLRDMLGFGSGRAVPFKNVDQALTWYAWRRYGKLFLVFIATSLLVVFLGGLLSRILDSRDTVSASRDFINAMYGAIGVAGLLFGFAAMLFDFQEMVRGVNTLMLLPVRSLRLAWAALSLIGAELTLAGLTVTLLMPLLLYMRIGEGAWNEVLSLRTAAVAIGSVVTGWIVTLLAIPLFYAGIFTACVMYVFFASETAAHTVEMFMLFAFPVLFGVVGLIIAWRGRYLVKKNLVYMGVALAVGLCTSALVAPYFHTSFSGRMPTLQHMIIFSAAFLVPLPFIVLPAVIDMGRRR